MYQIFDHTADLGLRVRADSLHELFADAAYGLFSIIVLNLEDVHKVQEKNFHLKSGRYDYLLFDWLNELLYTFETEKLLLSDFKVQVAPSDLRAMCRGQLMNPAVHKMEHEVKAITYHELKLERTEDGWLAEIIVDI